MLFSTSKTKGGSWKQKCVLHSLHKCYLFTTENVDIIEGGKDLQIFNTFWELLKKEAIVKEKNSINRVY